MQSLMSLRTVSILKASLVILAITKIAEQELSMFEIIVILSLSYIDTVIDKPTYIILGGEDDNLQG